MNHTMVSIKHGQLIADHGLGIRHRLDIKCALQTTSVIAQHVSLSYKYSYKFLVEVCHPVLQILSLTKMLFSTPIFRPGLSL